MFELSKRHLRLFPPANQEICPKKWFQNKAMNMPLFTQIAPAGFQSHGYFSIKFNFERLSEPAAGSGTGPEWMHASNPALMCNKKYAPERR